MCRSAAKDNGGDRDFDRRLKLYIVGLGRLSDIALDVGADAGDKRKVAAIGPDDAEQFT